MFPKLCCLVALSAILAHGALASTSTPQDGQDAHPLACALPQIASGSSTTTPSPTSTCTPTPTASATTTPTPSASAPGVAPGPDAPATSTAPSPGSNSDTSVSGPTVSVVPELTSLTTPSSDPDTLPAESPAASHEPASSQSPNILVHTTPSATPSKGINSADANTNPQTSTAVDLAGAATSSSGSSGSQIPASIIASVGGAVAGATLIAGLVVLARRRAQRNIAVRSQVPPPAPKPRLGKSAVLSGVQIAMPDDLQDVSLDDVLAPKSLAAGQAQASLRGALIIGGQALIFEALSGNASNAETTVFAQPLTTACESSPVYQPKRSAASARKKGLKGATRRARKTPIDVAASSDVKQTAKHIDASSMSTAAKTHWQAALDVAADAPKAPRTSLLLGSKSSEASKEPALAINSEMNTSHSNVGALATSN